MAGPTSTQLAKRAQDNAEAAGLARLAAWIFAVIAVGGALLRVGRADLDVGSALVALSWILVFGGVAAAFGLLATLLSGQSLVLRTLGQRVEDAPSAAGASDAS